jgi:hypothetical protein
MPSKPVQAWPGAEHAAGLAAGTALAVLSFVTGGLGTLKVALVIAL